MNEKMMATKCPSRKLQMITFNIQLKHSYVNCIHIYTGIYQQSTERNSPLIIHERSNRLSKTLKI